jgi:hypothetical protein
VTAGSYDISIDRGFDWGLSLTWNDSSGDPYDLTAWSADMKIRPAYSDQTTLTYAWLSTATGAGINGTVALGGNAGTIVLSIPAATTANIPAGNAVYDLRLTNPSGQSTKLLYGIVQVWDEVTDD